MAVTESASGGVTVNNISENSILLRSVKENNATDETILWVEAAMDDRGGGMGLILINSSWEGPLVDDHYNNVIVESESVTITVIIGWTLLVFSIVGNIAVFVATPCK